MSPRIDRRWQGAGLLLLLAGCVPSTGQAPPPSRPAPVQPAPVAQPGLEGVTGRTAAQIAQLFGRPDLDIREGAARKLQFSNEACVLDAYLYPRAGGGEPVVTYVDSRLPDGRDADRAVCAASLSRR